jgi:hypothetical protein
VRKPSEGTVAIGGLIVFAFWLFVVLPLLIGPNYTHSHNQETNKCSAEQSQNHGFWEKADCDPVAYFTIWLVGFTGVLAASTIGLWIVTWRANVRQAREIGQIERPFVFLEGFSDELTVAADNDETEEEINSRPAGWQRAHRELVITRFAAIPRWKNGGRTPTEKMRIQTNWLPPDQPIPAEYGYRNLPVPFFLGPQDVQQSEFIEIPPAIRLVDHEMTMRGPAPIILIWGRADYEDVFGEPHFLEWCYRLRFSRPRRHERMTARFVQWGEHNRSG